MFLGQKCCQKKGKEKLYMAETVKPLFSLNRKDFSDVFYWYIAEHKNNSVIKRLHYFHTSFFLFSEIIQRRDVESLQVLIAHQWGSQLGSDSLSQLLVHFPWTLYHELNRPSLSDLTICGFAQLEGTPSCHTTDKHHLLPL